MVRCTVERITQNVPTSIAAPKDGLLAQDSPPLGAVSHNCHNTFHILAVFESQRCKPMCSPRVYFLYPTSLPIPVLDPQKLEPAQTSCRCALSTLSD